MKAKTRMFGEIDIQEDKIITLESGMIGFPDMQKFTLILMRRKAVNHILCGFSLWMIHRLRFRSSIR